MPRTLSLVAIFASITCVFVSPTAVFSEPPIVCGVTEEDLLTSSASDSGAICMNGDLKVLVVFAQFRDDPSDSGTCYRWSDADTTLQPWMRAILDSNCSTPGDCRPAYTSPDSCDPADPDPEAVAELEPPSLTHYYHQMSGGKFWFYGDVFPYVVKTPQDRSHYTGDDCTDEVGLATIDILNAIDSTVDFGDYDNYPRNGYVDLVLVIWRDFRDPCATTGFAWLSDYQHALTTADSLGGTPVKIALDRSGFRPSGVTLEGQNVFIALQQAAHEVGHLYFTRGPEDWRFNHLQYQSSFGIMDANVMWIPAPGDTESGAGMSMSAFERDRLGWLTPTVVTASTRDTLDDAIEHEQSLKISWGDSTQYFLLENRANKSWYDRNHSGELGWPSCGIWGLPNRGLAIYHVDHKGSPGGELVVSSGIYRKLVDVELASGLFDSLGSYTSGFRPDPTRPNPARGIDSLDMSISSRHVTRGLFGNGEGLSGPTSFATYTSPNTSRYRGSDSAQVVFTGINVENIIGRADSTIMLDITFAPNNPDSSNHVVRPSSSAFTAKWAGWLYLAGDVVIDSLVTVDVAPGTAVRVRDNYDRSALFHKGGADAFTTEIIVAGGGTLDVNGGSGHANAVFTSANPSPDSLYWYGIRVKTNASADLLYADVSRACVGVAATSPKSVKVARSSLHDNGYYGFYAEAVNDTIDVFGSQIYGNGMAGISVTGLKKLSGTHFLLSRVDSNQVYLNGADDYVGNDLEFWSLGGVGLQTDSVRYNSLGTASGIGSYGIWSNGGQGGHRTVVYLDTLRNYGFDAINLSEVDTVRVRRCRIYDAATNALRVSYGATACVDTCWFDSTNAAHVLVDTLTSVVLGNLALGSEMHGANAFLGKPTDPTRVLFVNRGSDTLKVENNWFNENPCSVAAPAARFSESPGPIDRMPRLCTQPSPARPWGGGEATRGSQAFAARLWVSPNPGGAMTRLDYAVPGVDGETALVELAIYDVGGRRVRALYHGRQAPGAYWLHWHGATDSGAAAPAGIYFARLSAGSANLSSKIVLVR